MAGLLLNLSHGTGEEMLVTAHFALGERPVVVAGAMDEADLDPSARPDVWAPHHGTSRDDRLGRNRAAPAHRSSHRRHLARLTFGHTAANSARLARTVSRSAACSTPSTNPADGSVTSPAIARTALVASAASW